MDKITKDGILTLLNEDWAGYVARIQALSPEAQQAFLEKQGYKRLADLLAHIVAWWQVGMQNIRNYRSDPEAVRPEIEVNDFNARAVERVKGVSNEQEIQAFEAARLEFAKQVQAMDKADFMDERILNQLRWELVNHLEEHRIV